MSAQDNGGSAFPCLPPQDTAAGSAVGYPHPEAGMTLRDYFAAKCLPVVAPGYERAGKDFIAAGDYEALAIGAYELADAMLKARNA